MGGWGGPLAQLDVHPTEAQDAGLTPAGSAILLWIDHEMFSTVILSLLLIQEGQLSVSCERIPVSTIVVNHLGDKACPVKVLLGK